MTITREKTAKNAKIGKDGKYPRIIVEVGGNDENPGTIAKANEDVKMVKIWKPTLYKFYTSNTLSPFRKNLYECSLTQVVRSMLSTQPLPKN